MHIAIVGPVSPGPLQGFMHGSDAQVARSVIGNHGTSPTSIAAELLAAGHRVTVVSHRRGHGQLELSGPHLTFHQVSSLRSGARQALDWWASETAEMMALVVSSGADVVHAHWTYEWATAALRAEMPTLITVRDAPLTVLRYMPDAYRLSRTVLAYKVRWAARDTALSAVSPYMAQAWKRQMAWRRDVHVVPNMTPQDMVGVTPKTAHPLVVEVADAGSRKNIQGLLRAFRDVRRRVPDAELRLVGPGLGQTDPLAVAALGAGLAKGVTFLGAVSRTEVARHLSEAWVHAHAAFEESFGNTLVEAMALGTPVLGGSMSAAVPWVLDGGRAGLLSDVSDHRALAQDISDLLDDERARAGLAGAGLHRVQTTFSPSAVREGYEKLYQIVRTS